MWRSLFSSAILLACSISSAVAQQNPVPDSSFEFWSHGVPIGWSANSPLVAPSLDAHSGHFAAVGSVRSTADSAPYLYAAFPISVRPNMFVGNFQLHSVQGDELMVLACTFSHGAPVSQAIFVDSESTDFYHPFNVPFLLANDDPPDSAMVLIELENSSGALHPGSSFEIDDVSFMGAAYDPFVSVTPMSAPPVFCTAAPNPAPHSTTLHFTAPGSGKVTITVVNSLGAECARIYSGELSAGEHSFHWNAGADLPRGMYEFMLRSEGSERYVPVLLE